MDYVLFGYRMKKRYMISLLMEEQLQLLMRQQPPLSAASLRNQLLGYLLGFHAKYVATPLHPERNSDSIQKTGIAKEQHKD
jgi:hypothetical protein